METLLPKPLQLMDLNKRNLVQRSKPQQPTSSILLEVPSNKDPPYKVSSLLPNPLLEIYLNNSLSNNRMMIMEMKGTQTRKRKNSKPRRGSLNFQRRMMMKMTIKESLQSTTVAKKKACRNKTERNPQRKLETIEHLMGI